MYRSCYKNKLVVDSYSPFAFILFVSNSLSATKITISLFWMWKRFNLTRPIVFIGTAVSRLHEQNKSQNPQSNFNCVWIYTHYTCFNLKWLHTDLFMPISISSMQVIFSVVFNFGYDQLLSHRFRVKFHSFGPKIKVNHFQLLYVI